MPPGYFGSSVPLLDFFGRPWGTADPRPLPPGPRIRPHRSSVGQKGIAVINEVRVPRRIIDGDFAGWLTDSMKARRMSGRMVAMRSGIDHSTISRLRRSQRDPQLSTAIALIALLETATSGDGDPG
ncbi:MAG: helix-turn-helix domain-containing protein [Candidatus Limnocylindria bacterium]